MNQLTLNLAKLIPYVNVQQQGKIDMIQIAQMTTDVYRCDLHYRLQSNDAETVSLIYKQTVRSCEIRIIEMLNAIPVHLAIPQLLDWSIDINAPTDRVNDQPVHWYITPYYEGVTLGFEDDIPAAIIATLAYIHAHFASRLEDLPDFYHPQMNAQEVDSTFDNAFSILTKAQREKPHSVFDEAYQQLSITRDNPNLFDALDALPLTLTHGDVHPGNMSATSDGEAILFDWGNARIAPPMLDLANMVEIDSPNWTRYCKVWAHASGQELDNSLARLGYYWATVLVNAFYLPYAIDYTPLENVQSMVGKIMKAEQMISKLIRSL